MVTPFEFATAMSWANTLTLTIHISTAIRIVVIECFIFVLFFILVNIHYLIIKYPKLSSWQKHRLPSAEQILSVCKATNNFRNEQTFQ